MSRQTKDWRVRAPFVFSLACLALALFVGLTNYDLLLRIISPYLESASIIALVLSVLLTIFLIYKLFTIHQSCNFMIFR